MATNPSPMAPEVPASMSSDSESSLSDDAPSVDLAALHRAVEENPHDFNAHLALVNAIRSSGADVHALRVARENFAQEFPLPPHLWKEWLDDERRIASSPQERNSLLHALFPKALRDYMSVELHQMRLDLAFDMCAAGEMDSVAVRDAFLDSCRAGAIAVLHAGEALWNTFRVRMSNIDEGIVKSLSFADATALKGHVFAMEDAANLTQECDVFEAKLKEKMAHGKMEWGQASDEVIMQFRSYAAYAKNVSDIFAIGVYERCVAVCFLNPIVWLEYIRFCQTARKEFAYSVCQRAIRNVPWAMELWTCALLALPDADETHLGCSKVDEYLGVIRRVKDYVMQSNDMRGALMLTKAVWTVFLALGHPSSHLDEILTTLTFNVSGTSHWASAQCHAVSVLCLTEDVSRAAALLDEVIATRPHETRWWLAYGKFLRETKGSGANDEIRMLFERAVLSLSSLTELDLLSDAWVRFECESDMERASVAERVAHVYSVVDTQFQKIGPARGVQGPEKRSDMRTGKKTRTDKGADRNLPKRKRAKPAGASRAGTDNVKEDGMEDDQKEMGVRTVDKMLDDGANGKMEILPSSERRGETVEDPTQSKKKTATPEAKRRSGGERVVRGTGEVEPKTIFINNLAFNVSEEELRKEFEFAGKITEVRMPRRSDGASKGRAYVEFKDEECVEKALIRHMKPIKGRTVWVRRSKPPARKTSRARGGGQPRARTTLRGPIGMLRPRVLITAETGPDDKDRDVKMEEDEDIDAANGEKEVTKPKSQDELRAMFTSKK